MARMAVIIQEESTPTVDGQEMARMAAIGKEETTPTTDGQDTVEEKTGKGLVAASPASPILTTGDGSMVRCQPTPGCGTPLGSHNTGLRSDKSACGSFLVEGK
jgi:hypothetical protein